MKFDIKNTVNSCKLAASKHSPEILVVTGIVGVVTSAVMACKETRRLDPVLEAHKQNAEAVHKKYAQNPDERAEKRELTGVYLKTGLGFVKLYGPSVTLGALSITGILASNNILRKRNMALAAAYATIDASFKQYRGRVIERFGEQADKELRLGAHQEKIEVTETDENGKEKPLQMGCYRIGVGRTMAAAVEQNNDADGIIWPRSIAPYEAIVVPVNAKNEDQMAVAEEIYQGLLAQGVDAIIDDRKERAGVKFKDADLIGYPMRITVSPKALEEGSVEVKIRRSGEVKMVEKANAISEIVEILKNL